MRPMGPKKNMSSHPNVGRGHGVRDNSNRTKGKYLYKKNVFSLNPS